MFDSIKYMIESAEKLDLPLHEFIIQKEIETSEKSRDEVIKKLNRSLDVMKDSLKKGIEIDVVLPIRDAMEQSKKMLASPFFFSKDIKEAVYWAMSIIEYNCGMGLICAAPTAGSCGVFPATILKAKEILDLVYKCKGTGVSVKITPDPFEIIIGKTTLDAITDIPFIDAMFYPVNGWRRTVKRFMDVVGSIIGLLVLTPVFALIAIAIKLDSEGPVFYHQERLGKDGKIFNIWKLYGFR